MNLKREQLLVIGIFLLVLTIRLILAFTTPNFTYESYYHLRQIEHITQTGIPAYDDPISYGGREITFLPLFHYVLAIFAFIFPLELVAKILPNLFIASLTIISYLIATRITTHKHAPIYTAFITGFLPILFYTNDIAVETLFYPLLFLALYTFMRFQEEQFMYGYILLLFLLCLTSPATFLLIAGFGIYIILSFTEGKKIDRGELELILFSLFFFIWTQIIFFKKNFLKDGPSFIWHNIPTDIIHQYFPTFSLGQSIVLVSIIPFVIGIYVVYQSVFRLKTTKSFLLISFAIATALLSWFRLIPFKTTLAFFGVLLAILFSLFYEELMNYLQKTKISSSHPFFSVGIIILLAATMIYPAYIQNQSQEIPSESEIQSFKWLRENSASSASIFAPLKLGHLVTYYAQRSNFFDDQFALITDVEKRIEYSNLLLTTPFETQALDIIDRYHLKYIIIIPPVNTIINPSIPPYLASNCFSKVYDQEIKMYYINCALKET